MRARKRRSSPDEADKHALPEVCLFKIGANMNFPRDREFAWQQRLCRL
jgi:hypothetical protein